MGDIELQLNIDIANKPEKPIASDDPNFVTTESVATPDLPGTRQDVFVVTPHTHNDIDSPRIKERDLLMRTERVYLTVPGAQAATATNYGVVFLSTFPAVITKIWKICQAAGTDAGAVGLNIEKLTGTQALDAGSTILTTNFNLKGTANTLEKGDLTAVRKNRTLAVGDRLALKDSGTLTAVAGVLIIIELQRLN